MLALTAQFLSLRAWDRGWGCPCAPKGNAARSQRVRLPAPPSCPSVPLPMAARAHGGARGSSAVPTRLGTGIEASPELPAGHPQLVHGVLLALQPLGQRPHRLALQDCGERMGTC